MMRRYLYFVIMLMFLSFYSCNEDEIKIFDGQSQLYFDKFYMNALRPGTEGADSTVMSFFFYTDGTQTIEAEVVVNYSGLPLTDDIAFSLKVIEEGTTANKDEYDLDAQYIFHARPLQKGQLDIQDTIKIRLNLSERLKKLEKGVRLFVELIPGEGIGLGQYERRRAVIISSYVAEKPTWWDSEVELTLLGVYSSTKYKLFVEHADPEMTMDREMFEERQDLAIGLVLKFKEWLIANPGQKDENGNDITVVI